MNKVLLVLALLALSATPFTAAHDPPRPVTTCQHGQSGMYHDFLPGAPGPLLVGGDGNLDGCNTGGVAALDGELDHGYGGAILAVNGGDGATWGSLVCHGMNGHHSGVVYAQSLDGTGPAFRVESDFSRTPPGTSADCGDGFVEPCDSTPPPPSGQPFPVNVVIDTVNDLAYGLFGPGGGGMTCNPSDCSEEAGFTASGPSSLAPSCAPGLDGTYLVRVVNDLDWLDVPLAGHVWTDAADVVWGPQEELNAVGDVVCTPHVEGGNMNAMCMGQSAAEGDFGSFKCGSRRQAWQVVVEVHRGDADVEGWVKCAGETRASCGTGSSFACKSQLSRSKKGPGECDGVIVDVRVGPVEAVVKCEDPIHPWISVSRVLVLDGPPSV